jgi:HSP20 family protein
MSSLFDRFFGAWPELFVAGPLARPFEVEETDKEVVVRAEAPGLEAADFDVNLTGDVLTIRAGHKEEKGKEGEPEAERRYFRVGRTVTLPPGIDPEKVAAFYRNGVLEVHLPRKPEALGRRIEVEA